MRIALVLFLIFAVTLPFFAQSDQVNSLLDQGRLLIEKKEFNAALDKFNSALKWYEGKEGFALQVDSLFDISKDLLISNEDVFAKKITEKMLQLLPPKDTLAASAFQLLGTIEMKNKKTKNSSDLF